MTSIRELITKLGFEVEHEKLSKVEEQLEGIKRRLEFLGAAELAKGAFELTERFAKFAEELHVTASSAGITVEAMQKLGFAAQKSSVSQEELGGSMARLARRLYEAKTGSAEAQKAFIQAGITTGQIQGFKTGKDALLALSDRFKEIQDPIKKQALAMELLGRGSINMVGFLSKGSGAIREMGGEAEKLGVVLSGEQVEALVEVEHGMQKLWAVIKNVGATIAANLAPSINYVIDVLLKFYEANGKLITSRLSEWIYDILYALGFLFGVFGVMIKRVYEFAQSHQALTKFIFVLLGIGAACVALFMAVQKVISIFIKLSEVAEAIGTILSSPFVLLGLAIAGIVIAIHDLWNGLQGKPTWLGSFIEWLGIGQQVQDVCFAIFDIISDILNLDFSKLFKDVIDDVKSLLKLIVNLGAGIAGLFGLTSKEGIGKTASDAVSSVGKYLGFGKSPSTPNEKAVEESGASQTPGFSPRSASAVLQNLELAPSIGVPSSSLSSKQPVNQNMNYSVNAPISITVPPGTDHRVVGTKVKEGIKEHMDRVYREAQRSLTPAQVY